MRAQGKEGGLSSSRWFRPFPTRAAGEGALEGSGIGGQRTDYSFVAVQIGDMVATRSGPPM